MRFTVRIYLDNCCYNRPYDDQSQTRINEEAKAKLFVQEQIREGAFELVTSYMLLYENSRNRFETSALSFLASCHTKADVESKIKIFRQFISSDLPPLWEQFFKSLLQHCHPLKEDKTAYKRYTLDPENRDLVQLITTDPALRQLVIRAEGYRIMVKNDDLKKFETQLKKHGYLL